MHFELVGSITSIETFAVGASIREIDRLRRVYGPGRWRKRKGVATVRLSDGTLHRAEVHWSKRLALAAANLKSNTYWIKTSMSLRLSEEYTLVICVRNDEYPAALEVRKIYEVLPDPLAKAHHLLRVIDESGEDYLYPEEYFVPIDLPQTVRAALRLVA